MSAMLAGYALRWLVAPGHWQALVVEVRQMRESGLPPDGRGAGEGAPAMKKRPGGFIKLYRAIRENPIYKQKPYSPGQAWIDLLLAANYAYAPWAKNVRGNSIPVPRGGVGSGAETLASEWGWTRKAVRFFLKRLEAEGMIRIVPHGRILNVILLTNYGKYQGKPSEPKTQ